MFIDFAKHFLNCTWPFVKVLQLVNCDLKPAVGYVYQAMFRANKHIQNKLQQEEWKYKTTCDIIDQCQKLQACSYTSLYMQPQFS